MEISRQEQMANLWVAANKYKIEEHYLKIVKEAFLGGCKFVEGELNNELGLQKSLYDIQVEKTVDLRSDLKFMMNEKCKLDEQVLKLSKIYYKKEKQDSVLNHILKGPLVVIKKILKDDEFDEKSDVICALNRISDDLSKLLDTSDEPVIVEDVIYDEPTNLSEDNILNKIDFSVLHNGTIKNKELEELFILNFENKHGGNWLNGTPDLIMFLKEYNELVQNNTAIEFGEWLKTFDALEREGGQWVIETQITTEDLFKSFLRDK